MENLDADFINLTTDNLLGAKKQKAYLALSIIGLYFIKGTLKQ